MNDFKKLAAVMMSLLGISSFMKDDKGQSILSKEQQDELSKKYGQQFVDAFKKDLAEFEKDGSSIEAAITPEVKAEMVKQQAEDAKMIKELRGEINDLKAKMNILGKLPAGDDAENREGEEMMEGEFKPDMSLALNKVYMASADKGTYQYNGNETIETTELRKEFDRYVSSDKLAIFAKLLAPTNSVTYMSTLVTDKFEFRATQAQIGPVLQAFVPEWTPKGKSKFTPLTIQSYPCKINVPIKPANLMNDALGYLYDEKLTPKDMPIVRYIVERLIKPQLDIDRELAITVGRYVEPEVDSHGQWVAGETEGTMTGYLTQLCDLKKNNNPNVNWLLASKTSAGLGTGAELLKNIDDAVDQVSREYRNQKLTIHADPDLVTKYGRAYRDKYPNTKNEDGDKVRVDFTKFTFEGLEGMVGSGAFFITPKNNFKHMLSRDTKTMGLHVQEADYVAKIFGEWREGTGFLIAEAISAFIPDALVQKLSPSPEAASVTTDEGGI